jgi:hypothetical protein
MIPATHPLSKVRAELEQIAATGDHRRLAELLHGERLPSLGGHEEPAELIHGAITIQPYRPQLVLGLAPVLGAVLMEQAAAIAGGLDRTRSFDLRNGLLLAELFPRSEAIFRGVVAAYDELPGYAANVGQSTDQQDLGARLREALRWQQTDDRLESFWFELLKSKKQTDLLDGFRGILWLPTSPAETEAVTVARIEKGLRSFASGAVKSENSELLIGWAVRSLDEARPRSSTYWQRNIAALAMGWPRELRDAFQKRWPSVALPKRIHIKGGGYEAEVDVLSEVDVKSKYHVIPPRSIVSKVTGEGPKPGLARKRIETTWALVRPKVSGKPFHGK